MSDAAQTLVVLAVVSLGFITQVVPLYVSALAGALALAFLGIIPMEAVYTSLANPTLVLFAGMFVIGASLFHTGLAQLLGTWVVRKSRGSESRLLWGIMAVTMGLSTFASNTGTAAALVPVILSLCHLSGLPASRFLMPMAFTTGFAGFSTMVGTPPNLIVSEALRQAGHRPLGFFEFAWVCIPTALAGMAYMAFIGRRLLPASPRAATAATPGSAPGAAKAAAAAEDPRLQGWSVPVDKRRMWLSGLILLAVILSMLANSERVPLESAALLTPIGLSLSQEIGADPHALLVSIAVASSLSFLTPMSTPPNTLVMNAGGYRFVDYLKVGGGLTVVCLLVAGTVIPLRWPVFP